ncbi:MAG: DUF5996 family protein, partial [Ruegeria sp.]
AGFWAGGNGADEAMFYSYAYPVPDGFSDAPAGPDGAYFDSALGEFLLPYQVVAQSDDPARTLLAFLQSTYEAAARAADWDTELECPLGVPGVPRPVAGA